MKQSGITLIELLIVVLVIGVLAGTMVAVTNTGEVKDIAQDGVRLANIKQVVEAIESYRPIEGSYPASEADLNSKLVPDYLANNLGFYGIKYEYDSSNASFYVYIQNAKNTVYKYDSNWGTIADCPTALTTVLATCDELDE